MSCHRAPLSTHTALSWLTATFRGMSLNAMGEERKQNRNSMGECYAGKKRQDQSCGSRHSS